MLAVVVVFVRVKLVVPVVTRRVGIAGIIMAEDAVEPAGRALVVTCAMSRGSGRHGGMWISVTGRSHRVGRLRHGQIRKAEAVL